MSQPDLLFAFELADRQHRLDPWAMLAEMPKSLLVWWKAAKMCGAFWPPYPKGDVDGRKRLIADAAAAASGASGDLAIARALGARNV